MAEVVVCEFLGVFAFPFGVLGEDKAGSVKDGDATGDKVKGRDGASFDRRFGDIVVTDDIGGRSSKSHALLRSDL